MPARNAPSSVAGKASARGGGAPRESKKGQRDMTFFTWLATLVLTAAQVPATQQPQRFDYQVRADFFAGVAGDEARMNEAMDLCERTLAENPKHAEAMVWHGAGAFVRAGQAFQKGDMAAGGQLFGRAMKEMNDAVAIFSGATWRTPWRQLIEPFTISMLFTVCIVPPAAFAMPRLAPMVWSRFRFPFNWGVVIVVMVAVALTGSAIAIGLLRAVGYIHPGLVQTWFLGSLRTSIIM